jgi:hypothetical protein
MSKRLRAILHGGIIVVILLFWGLAIARHWDQFVSYPWQVSPTSLLLAFAAAMAEIFVVFAVWWRALALTGVRIPWQVGVQVFFRAQIARYLPGGIWDLVGRFVLASQAGVGKRAMAASMGLEMGLQVLSGGVFLLLALALRSGLAMQSYLGLSVVIIVGALIFLSPPVFTAIVNFGLKLLKKPALVMQLTWWGLFQLFLLRLLGHVLMGLGFFFMVRGIAPIPLDTAPLLITSFVGAWLIGYLAIIAPMGIGIREGALVLLTSSVLPFSVATAAVVGYRLLFAIRDMIAAGIGIILARRQPQPPNAHI